MKIKTFCTGPVATNSFLLIDPKTKEAMVIDAPFELWDPLFSVIQAEKLKPKALLLTHSHWDHTASAAQIQKDLSLPIYIHSLDVENLQSPGADGLPLMFPIDPAKPDHLLSDRMSIPFAGEEIEVIHTPGHSPGSVCFYLKNHDILFSGDTLFRHSIGNISFPQSDPEKMWESLKKLAILRPNTKVFPGHGETTTIGEESWLSEAKQHFGG